MIELLHKGTRILNVDESFINETNFTRMMWRPPKAPGTMISKAVTPRLALIAALDTDGNVYYSLGQCNTDSDMMMLYMRHLLRRLDEEAADWRDNTIFLMDNASYHSSEDMKEYFKKMEIKVIYSGPYSYTSAPIELLFGALKQGELNPDGFTTGKR